MHKTPEELQKLKVVQMGEGGGGIGLGQRNASTVKPSLYTPEYIFIFDILGTLQRKVGHLQVG